jgi:ParB family chromosome partitioning protein
MTETVSVSPFRCRMWNGHDRLDGYIDEHSCRDEIKSVLKHGQRLPVLGRRIHNDISHDIELIYGARRLFIARHLNLPLLIELREIADRDAIIALDIENRQRKELSPYERGRAFSAWLQAGHFDSQEDLAHVLNISASQVSRLLKLAELPAAVVSAFADPTQICENWAPELIELWNNHESKNHIIKAARSVSRESPQPSAATIYKRLLAAGVGRDYSGSAAINHDEVVTDDSGNPLFRVSTRTKDIALLLPAALLSNSCLSEIKVQITSILQRARTQATESPRELTRKTRSSTPRNSRSGALATHINHRATF